MQVLTISVHDLQMMLDRTAEKTAERVMQAIKEVSSNHIAEDIQWLTLEQLCNYLPDKPAKQTVYGWVSSEAIPFHKGPKKLRFLKSEVDTWLKAGRKFTAADTDAAADNFLSRAKQRA